MNRAREMDLEDALKQAVSVIEFLHGCLTDDTYKYDFPWMTEDELKRLRPLLPDRPGPCVHSRYVEECPSCEYRVQRGIERAIQDAWVEPRWRDSRWRDLYKFSGGATVCEDTGALATGGICPVHGGDACLYSSSVLVTALRELADD